VLYKVLIFFLDRVYKDRAIERFWFLETVARMPYFSYVTCLHLYETLGWWRTGEMGPIPIRALHMDGSAFAMFVCLRTVLSSPGLAELRKVHFAEEWNEMVRSSSAPHFTNTGC
jgi:ubiquinol oxidase